jgi:GH24 family phage-related lysozyme (muramidase)
VRLSTKGARLIEEFEGFSASPYRDAVGVWTIGYGSTKGVGPSTPRVTRREAEARLKREVDATYGAAVNALQLPLNQNQFDALVSFVYNVGPGGVGSGTQVGRALRRHDWTGAANALLAWNKAGGRILAGLTRRRKAERALFLTPDRIGPGYTKSETRWIREYDKLRREDRDPDRRRVLRRVMKRQRKRVWRAAENDPRGRIRGWRKANRRARYRSLLSRTR